MTILCISTDRVVLKTPVPVTALPVAQYAAASTSDGWFFFVNSSRLNRFEVMRVGIDLGANFEIQSLDQIFQKLELGF
jgi:hypothetical protein